MSERVILSPLALFVAAVALSACGSTVESSETSAAPVVRSPIVADDAAPAAPAKRSRRHATMAPIPDPPDRPEPAEERVARADDRVPAGAAKSSSSGPPGGTPVPAETTTQPSGATPGTAPSESATVTTPPAEAAPSPTPVPAPSDTLGTPVEPAPTVTAEATTPEPTPATPGLPLTLADLREMMNAPVAGFPLWMLVLAGILLAAGLVFGTGGRPKRERAEPAYEERAYEEPAYEEPRYGEADGEPKPA